MKWNQELMNSLCVVVPDLPEIERLLHVGGELTDEADGGHTPLSLAVYHLIGAVEDTGNFSYPVGASAEWLKTIDLLIAHGAVGSAKYIAELQGHESPTCRATGERLERSAPDAELRQARLINDPAWKGRTWGDGNGPEEGRGGWYWVRYDSYDMEMNEKRYDRMVHGDTLKELRTNSYVSNLTWEDIVPEGAIE